MTKPILAPAFCQVAWVVRDMAAAEKFFVETMGISRFLYMDNLAQRTPRARISGSRELGLQSAYRLCRRHSDRTDPACIGRQHTRSRWIDMVTPFSTSRMAGRRGLRRRCGSSESSGYPMIQSLRLPILRVRYFDTRRAIGVVIEIVGASEQGHEFRRNLKAGTF